MNKIMNLFFSLAKYLLPIILTAWCVVLLAQKIDLPVADLGRHIKNGEILIHPHLASPLKGEEGEEGIWQIRWQLLNTNFYSYTEPEHNFVNHHWLSGVVFYLVHQAWGFEGLSVFYILLVSLAFFVCLKTAKNVSNWTVALGVGVLVLPIITQRVEIRPEGFTYLFLAVFYWVLQNYAQSSNQDSTSPALRPLLKLRGTGQAPSPRLGRGIWFLPLVMLLWVNLHIGFIFGFLILGAFMLIRAIEDLRYKIKDKNHQVSLQLKYLIGVFMGCLVAGLINPFGIHALLYPLNIFREYGYRIVENQSVRFLENLGITHNLNFGLFKFLVVLTALSFIGLAIKQKLHKSFQTGTVVKFCLFLTISILAFLAVRNFPIFGLVILPILAQNIYLLLPKSEHLAYKIFPAVVVVSLIFFSSLLFWQNFQNKKSSFGIGLMPQVEVSAEFFKVNKLQGPIFNNYDIGGYLIYELGQTNKHGLKQTDGSGLGEQINTDYRRVFTDNRPEAYSLAHFQKEYIPAQEDSEKWAELMQKYQFNAIFFSRRDLTPWGQNFLMARVKDPLWAPVFVDGYNIIFLKRDNPQNAEVIKKYALPKEMFGVSTK